MGSLKNAITNYIDCEKIINDAANKQSLLEKKYDEKLRNQSTNKYTVYEAEDIFAAHQAIEEHKQDIEKYKRNIVNSADVIAKYFSLLKGKTITDASLFNDENGYPLSYSFWIEDDQKVCHNHQKK